MNLGELLDRLEPVQQRSVALVYLEGCTTAEAARILAVERVEVAGALVLAFRRIAKWVMDDDDSSAAVAAPAAVARS